MDGGVIAFIVLTIVIPLIVAGSKEGDQTRARRAALAKELGFQVAEKDSSLFGRKDGFLVRVGERTQQSGPTYRYVEVTEGGLPPGLGAIANNVWTRPLVGGSDAVPTGDAAFDERVLVYGKESTVLAVLTEPARLAVRDVVAGGTGKILDGKLSLDEVGELGTRGSIVRLIERALKMARLLSITSAEVPARLEKIAFEDPDRERRVRSFTVLVEEFRDREEAERATTRALESAQPPMMRLLAALRRENVEILWSLALVRASEIRIPANEFFAGRGNAEAEARLIQLLEDGDTEVRLRAANALRRAGTVAAVEALLACAEAAPVIGRNELKKTCKAAVAQIQSRLGGAEAGRLSLAGPSLDGAVSIAAEGGALSIADPEDAS